MQIEYTDKQVETTLFEKINVTEVFMSMDGKLYMRTEMYWAAPGKPDFNCVDLEDGHYSQFGSQEFVRRIHSKLVVEI